MGCAHLRTYQIVHLNIPSALKVSYALIVNEYALKVSFDIEKIKTYRNQ